MPATEPAERGSYLLPCRMPVASWRRPCRARARAASVVGAKLMTRAARMPVMALVRSVPPKT